MFPQKTGVVYSTERTGCMHWTGSGLQGHTRGLRSGFQRIVEGWAARLPPVWWCRWEARRYCSCPGFSLRSAPWTLSAKKWRKWPVTRSGSACARVLVTMLLRCPTWSVTCCSRTRSCSWQPSRRSYSTAAPASSRYCDCQLFKAQVVADKQGTNAA